MGQRVVVAGELKRIQDGYPRRGVLGAEREPHHRGGDAHCPHGEPVRCFFPEAVSGIPFPHRVRDGPAARDEQHRLCERFEIRQSERPEMARAEVHP